MKVLHNYKRNQMILEKIFQGTNLQIMEGASGMHLGQTGFPGLHLLFYYFIEVPPINTLTHQPEPELFIPYVFCGPKKIFPGKTTEKNVQLILTQNTSLCFLALKHIPRNCICFFVILFSFSLMFGHRGQQILQEQYSRISLKHTIHFENNGKFENCV